MLLLLLIAITALYVASTYAKYTAQFTGKGTATVAKWAFKSENENKITTFNVSLDKSYDAKTLVANRIAPGSFDVVLTNEESEVGVDFTVVIGNTTNAPTNIKFYKDSNRTMPLTPGTDTITGQLEAGDNTGVEVKIYWEWVYETGTVTNGIATGDDADTTDGEAGAQLTIPITVKGVQTEPRTTAIYSHID